MKEDFIIGGEIMTQELQKISFKEFRKIHPTKDNWAVYWKPGDGYYKFPLKGTERARRKQIEQLFDKDLTIKQNRFIKDFSWIALYFYNSILLWEKEPGLPQKQWKEAFDNVILGYPQEWELHQMVKVLEIFRCRTKEKNRFTLKGKVSELLWLWLFSVWKGEVKVRRCETKRCNRIFIPSRKDHIFCSEQCRIRTTQRRIKRRNKLINLTS